MPLRDNKIRIIGAVAMGTIHYLFFMVELLASVPDQRSFFPLTLVTTCAYVLTQWEPIRWVLIATYKKWGHEHTWKRKMINAAILIPFAFLVEAGRIKLGLSTHYWTNASFPDWAVYLINFRVSLIFAFLQVVLYECFFSLHAKELADQKAEDLQRLNLQMQYDSLKVQVQPHFLFNTLNTLVGLIKIDARRATRFTEELAFVYRYFLKASDKTMVSLDAEINFTHAYYYLFKTRFPEGLEMTIPEITSELKCFELPTLSIQLLVENAIKHNSITSRSPLVISISIDPDAGMLTVSNNLQRRVQHASMGTGLTQLKKKYELIGLKAPIVQQTDSSFAVILPLKQRTIVPAIFANSPKPVYASSHY